MSYSNNSNTQQYGADREYWRGNTSIVVRGQGGPNPALEDAMLFGYFDPEERLFVYRDVHGVRVLGLLRK